jgi:hypothetical protein
MKFIYFAILYNQTKNIIEFYYIFVGYGIWYLLSSGNLRETITFR